MTASGRPPRHTPGRPASEIDALATPHPPLCPFAEAPCADSIAASPENPTHSRICQVCLDGGWPCPPQRMKWSLVLAA